MPVNSTVAILTSGGFSPQILINALHRAGHTVVVFEEQPEQKWVFLKRRARKFGWWTAVGQLGTMVMSRLGKRVSRRRIESIATEYGVNVSRDTTLKRVQIASVNQSESWKKINDHHPDVILCISCRILSKQALAAFRCPVLNFHSGILPQYRGQLGAYWARILNDDQNFGATVHLVDQGVDTGAVLYRCYARPLSQDTISTYPTLLAASSVDMVLQAVKDAVLGNLKSEATTDHFPQYYHPAVWSYLKDGFMRKIW